MQHRSTDERAVAVTKAIQSGNLDALRRLLSENADLATSRITDDRGVSRTLLHIASDWPGHFPNGAASVRALVAAGADVNAALISEDARGAAETPLHWAASSNDVAVLDALLDAGAEIDALGAVLTGGTPMSDAVIFAKWDAARRLVERGASTTIWQAAALGDLDRVRALWSQESQAPEEATNSLWHACRGGQVATAAFFFDRGANLNWVGYDGDTPLDAAHESGNADTIAYLTGRGALRAAEVL